MSYSKYITLCIDTAETKRTTVRLEVDNKIADELFQEQGIKSQVLLPLIDKLLKNNNIMLDDLSAIQVNPGPGSFTGLRVGLSVANTLGWTLGIPVNGQNVKVNPVEPNYE